MLAFMSLRRVLGFIGFKLAVAGERIGWVGYAFYHLGLVVWEPVGFSIKLKYFVDLKIISRLKMNT